METNERNTEASGTTLFNTILTDALAFKAEYLAGKGPWLNPGGSVIIDPDGKILAGPAMEEETILYADLHRDLLTGPRWQLDVAGQYARPDIFQLRVNRLPNPMLTEVTEKPEPA